MRNVLIFTPLYPPFSGGASTFYTNLTGTLSDSFNFVVVTASHPKKPAVTTENGNVIYRVIPRFDSAPIPARLVIESVSSFVIAVYLLVAKRIDLVHAHSTSFSTFGVGLATILTRTPIIYDCMDEDFPERLIKVGRTPYWFSCAPNIDKLLQQTGIPADRIVRVPVTNPEYVSEYSADITERSDERFKILFVGALRELKGVDLLVDVFAALAETRSEVHLTIIGDGPRREAIADKISSEGLSDRVRLLGEVEHREALEWMASASILVLPSESEGMPRVVSEALEIGIPVLATPVGAIPTVIRDEETGLLVERTRADLRKALERLHDEHGLLRRLARNVTEEYETESWETVSKTVANAYEEAV
jgi:glycosyltransferase involved in cell wall biosynthesis